MREINEQIHKGTLVHVRNRVGKRFRDRVCWQVSKQVERPVNRQAGGQVYQPIHQNLKR